MVGVVGPGQLGDALGMGVAQPFVRGEGFDLCVDLGDALPGRFQQGLFGVDQVTAVHLGQHAVHGGERFGALFAQVFENCIRHFTPHHVRGCRSAQSVRLGCP